MPDSSTVSRPSVGSGEIGDLALQVEDLQQRVAKLEKRFANAAAAPEPSAPAPPVPAPPIPDVNFDLSPSVVPLLGRALVAIAAAYVLRALTEWGMLPAAMGVAMGLIYALAWLWIAFRSPAEAGFRATLSCSTSVLIMGPLIWEAVNRLKVMSSASSAAVLAAFALIALGLAAKTRPKLIAKIAGASAIGMLFALLIARNDIVPFTTALLVVAAATEFATWRGVPGARAIAALGADCSVLVFSYLMSSRQGMPEAWAPVSPYAVLVAQIALALIYTGAALTQTIVRRTTLTAVEMAQTAAALAIGIGGAVWVFQAQRAVMFGLGVAALAGGVALYAVSFLLFERDSKWNFRAFATFGLLLVLVGIFLPFSRSGFWILACACAVAFWWVASVFGLPTLKLHGAIYLLLGAAAAGVTSQPFRALFGIVPNPVDWMATAIVLLTAATCWAAVANPSPSQIAGWRNQASDLTVAAHIAWIAAGLAVYALLGIWRIAAGNGSAGAPAYTLGTVVLTGISLALAWMGTRWSRPELRWLLYALMAICGYKLATRDFVFEHNLALVVSLLCYGGALILLPRLLRGKPDYHK